MWLRVGYKTTPSRARRQTRAASSDVTILSECAAWGISRETTLRTGVLPHDTGLRPLSNRRAVMQKIQ